MERKYKRFVRSEKHYVKLHTNTMEGYWAIYKRSLYGIFHRYSVERADLYLVELGYKYNNRGGQVLFLVEIIEAGDFNQQQARLASPYRVSSPFEACA